MKPTYLPLLLASILAILACDTPTVPPTSSEATWNLSIGDLRHTEIVIAAVLAEDDSLVSVIRKVLTNTSEYSILKKDKKGQTLWTRNINRDQMATATSLQNTEDDGSIIGGMVIIDEPEVWHKDGVVMKIDNNGKVIWRTQIGYPEVDEYVIDVKPTRDGGYIALIDQTIDPYEEQPPITESDQISIVRLDATGKILFHKHYGADGILTPKYIQETKENNILIAGTYQIVPDANLFMMQTDADGKQLWFKAVGEPGTREHLESPLGVAEIKGGGYAVVLTCYDDYYWVTGAKMVRLDKNGNELWRGPLITTPDLLVMSSIEETADNNFILSGYFCERRVSSNADLILLKSNGDGEELWRKIYGQGRPEYTNYRQDSGIVAHQTSDGGYMLAGNTQSFLPEYVYNTIGSKGNVWLIKTDENGYAPVEPQNLP